jgi:cytochrome c553
MTRIGLWGSILVLVLVGIGGFVSFFWLPRAQLDAYPTWYAAFCAALGVPEPRRAGLVVPLTSHSDVVLTHHLLEAPQPADIGHGATLALRCTPCHGPTGISYANSPNLAGQYATTVYKQLRDYQVGVRTNSIMNPMAQALSDTEMRQIAAYYASLPKPPESRLTVAPPPDRQMGRSHAQYRALRKLSWQHRSYDGQSLVEWRAGRVSGAATQCVLGRHAHE